MQEPDVMEIIQNFRFTTMAYLATEYVASNRSFLTNRFAKQNIKNI